MMRVYAGKRGFSRPSVGVAKVYAMPEGNSDVAIR
jgi:hypothetical protein